MNIALIIISSLVYFTLVGFELLEDWHPVLAIVVFMIVPSLVYWGLMMLIWRRRRIPLKIFPQAQRNSIETSTKTEIKQAFEVLDLPPTADQIAVVEAHRRLISQNHPDKGGSTHLAKLINEAKVTLIQHLKEDTK